MKTPPSSLADHPITLSRQRNERLTSRERVRLTLAHQEPDRVPMDFWATSEVKHTLQAHLGLNTPDEVLNFLGVDFRVAARPSYIGPALKTHSDGSRNDVWGVRRQTVSFGAGERQGSYQELLLSPLASMTTTQEIDAYPGWPSPDCWDYADAAADCRQYSDHCVIAMGDRMDRTAQLKPAMYLRGIEQIMLDLALNPEIVDCINEHIVAYFLEFNRRVFESAQGGIDIFMMGDDFGTQSSPLLSVEMWKRFYEPGFRKYIELAHRHGIKVMHHTCGSVRPLIPLFIDAGLDILQSLQPRAAGMDLRELKQEFGKDLCFQGGLDIQQTLPRGSPADVKSEVRDRLEAAKADGGYILCTAHNIQPDTPLENIIALFEAGHEYGKY